MASHGRDGVARWVLGSTAEAVIAQPPCAVLVMRAKMSEQGEDTRVEDNAGKDVVTR
jgi:hypothetical protein